MKNGVIKTWNITADADGWRRSDPSKRFTVPTITVGTPTQSTIPITITGGTNATSWVAEKRIGSGSWSTDATVTVGATSHTYTGLTSSTTYELRIRAFTAKGNNVTNSVSATTGANSGLEDDWILRSTGPGVQWAHDFRNASEFTKFFLVNSTGADQQPLSWLTRDTTDGIGNSRCLKFAIPAGQHCNHSWPRPYSCFPGDRGYVSGPDYPANVYGNWYSWRGGLYGHSDYHGQSGTWAGTDFYIQFRIKFSNGFFAAQPRSDGKLLYIDLPPGGNQEIIPVRGTQRFNMYTNFGGRSNSYLFEPQDGGSGPYSNLQPGGEFSPSTYWSWPENEWVTMLIHVIPGHHNGDSNQPNMSSPSNYADTGIIVYAAKANEIKYTKIWEKFNYVWSFDSNPSYGNQSGFGVFTPSSYFNGFTASADTEQKFTQIIFSKQFIPPPQDIGTPTWFTAATDLAIIPIAGGASFSGSAYQKGNRVGDVTPSYTTYPNAYGLEGPDAIFNDWTGGCVHQGSWSLILPAQGGHHGYRGNEVYQLKVRKEVPGWERIWGPSPNEQLNAPDHGYNPVYSGHADGSPRTTHGWFSVICDRDGRVYSTMQDDTNGDTGGGEWTTECYSLDTIAPSKGWTYHGRLWATIDEDVNAIGYQSGPGAYDPITHKFYRGAEGNNGNQWGRSVDIYTMLRAGLASTSTGPQVVGSTNIPLYNPGSPLSDSWSVITDSTFTTRCWIMASTENDNSNLWILNLDNFGAGFTQKTVGGTTTGLWKPGFGAVWHKQSRSILVGGMLPTAEGGPGTTHLYKIAISGTNALTATYTCTPITLTGVTPTAHATGFRGSYSKFQIIDDMGNGQAAIVMATQLNGPTYVIKIPNGI